MREVLACFNAGDFARALILFSDDLPRSFGPEPGETPEDVRAFVEEPFGPVPEADRIRLLAITDVSVMADERVGALLVSDDPAVPPEGVETELVVFVEERGRWVTDAVAEFTLVEEGGEDEAENAGTPAP